MRAAKIAYSVLFAAVSTGMLAATGCSSAPATPAEAANLADDGKLAVTKMERQNGDLKMVVEGHYGYAVFDVSKGGLAIGVVSGKGSVWQNGTDPANPMYLGTAGLSALKFGLIAGGSSYQELLVFQDEAALKRFTDNKLQFAASASAVALKAGASAQPKFDNGVAVYLFNEQGLEFDASIGGQQFTFTPAHFTGTAAPTAPAAAPTTVPASGT